MRDFHTNIQKKLSSMHQTANPILDNGNVARNKIPTFNEAYVLLTLFSI